MEYYCKTLHYRTMYFNNAYYRYFRFFLQGKCVPIQQLVYKLSVSRYRFYSTTVCSHSEIANIERNSELRSSDAVQKR